MSRGARGLLTLASLGMELAWRLAWVNYLGLLFLERGFSWGGAVGAFLGGALLTAFCRDRGWRVVAVLFFQALGLGLAVLHALHHFRGDGIAFWDSAWLARVGAGPQPVLAWLAVILVAGLAVALWWGGAAWSGRTREAAAVSLRLDWGLAALFLLFGMKFVLRTRFEELTPDPAAFPLLAAFFCFGLLALALARCQGDAARDYPAGGRLLGAGLGLAGSALLLGLGAFWFWQPALLAAAEAGYAALATVARPLLPIIVAVLRFLLMPQSRGERPAEGNGADAAPPAAVPPAEPSWLDEVFQVLGWIMIALILLAGLALLGFLAYRLWLRLWSRTPRRRSPRPARDPWGRLRAAWTWLRARLAGLGRRVDDPVAGYRALLAWGRRSGVPNRKAETPREYGRRLAACFPLQAAHIQAIVACLEATVYAGRPPAAAGWRAARRGLARLRRPDLWPRRLAVRWRRPDEVPGLPWPAATAPGKPERS